NGTGPGARRRKRPPRTRLRPPRSAAACRRGGGAPRPLDRAVPFPGLRPRPRLDARTLPASPGLLLRAPPSPGGPMTRTAVLLALPLLLAAGARDMAAAEEPPEPRITVEI